MSATQDAVGRSPERFPPDDPREWLNRARSHLGMARIDLPDVHPEEFCFSAQQAAERAIKAVLIQRGTPFPYVHDLAELLAVAEGAGETPPAPVRQAARLTRYAEVGRELELVPAVTAADRAAAVAIAEAVVAWAEERIAALRAEPSPPPSAAASPVAEPPSWDKNGGPEALPGVDRDALAEVVRRIVEVAAPERIILFGSAARGEMGPDSDFDLLVVKAGEFARRRVAGDIYMALSGVGRPVDIVVVTPEDVERYRNSFALVIAPAVRDGRVVYAK